MVTNKLNVQSRYNICTKRITTNLSLVFGLVILLFTGQSIFAQGSTIEKNNYKPKTTTKKTKAKPKKTTVKATPKKSTPKKSTPKAVRTKKSTSRSKNPRSKNSTLVTFTTSEPKLEIWNGEDSLGVTDENAILEKWMKDGNFLISVKNTDGEIIVDKLLVSINKDNNAIKLIAPPKIEEPKEPTAEELLQEKLKESADAAEKINDILKRYGDPMKTNTVSLSDWEFVYQNAQANTLKNFTAIQIEAQRWFSTGQIELAKGNYANAYTAFAEAAKYMPDSAYPFYALGDAHMANKEVDEALKAYFEAIKINPTFALANRKIGGIFLNTNRTKEAVSYFEAALKNGFDTPAVRFDLAKSHLKNKSWDAAAKELEIVVREAPTGDVYLTLGDLYSELKRNISAYEAYKKATELSPGSPIGYYKLGEILLSEKEYERAKVALEKSVELDEVGKQINVSQAKKLIRESAQKLK